MSVSFDLEGSILYQTLVFQFLSYGFDLKIHVVLMLLVACHSLLSYIKELKGTEVPTYNLEE